MSLARRLALPAALCAFLTLPLLVPVGSGAAETCTTAVGGSGERPTDAPSAAACATAVLLISPSPADPGVLVTLDGTHSTGVDAGDEIAGYDWEFGDGATAHTVAPQATVTHVYARNAYTARLTILDGTDAPLATTSVDLIVSEPPVAALNAPSGTLRPRTTYDFDAVGSTAPGGSIDHYVWDWGDGTRTQTSGPSTQHAFAGDDASRQVSVTAVNDLGLASAPATAPVTVLNQLPLVQLIAAPATVEIGQRLTLDATGTSDPDGTIAEYRWDLDANGSFETSTGTTPSVSAGGYPNPGALVLRVKAIDDTGGASVKGVTVTVARAAGGGGAGGVAGGETDSGSGAGGAGSGSDGGSGSGGSSADGAGDAFAVGLGGAAIQRLKAVLRRGIGLQAVANRAATGRLTVSVGARDAKLLHLPGRRGKRPVAIGGLSLALRAGRTAKPAIKLSAGATRALRRAKPRMLRVTIRGSLVAGADSAAVVRVVLLRG